MSNNMRHVVAADLAPLAAVLDPAYPERLREMAECLYLQLLEEDNLLVVEEDGTERRHQLALVALRQTDRLSQDLGGGNFYMHKATSYRLTQRDREMCQRFNGRNYSALAREYELSEMRVRQIVDAWQKEEFARRQGGLFGAESSSAASRPLQGVDRA